MSNYKFRYFFLAYTPGGLFFAIKYLWDFFPIYAMLFLTIDLMALNFFQNLGHISHFSYPETVAQGNGEERGQSALLLLLQGRIGEPPDSGA